MCRTNKFRLMASTFQVLSICVPVLYPTTLSHLLFHLSRLARSVTLPNTCLYPGLDQGPCGDNNYLKKGYLQHDCVCLRVIHGRAETTTCFPQLRVTITFALHSSSIPVSFTVSPHSSRIFIAAISHPCSHHSALWLALVTVYMSFHHSFRRLSLYTGSIFASVSFIQPCVHPCSRHPRFN